MSLQGKLVLVTGAARRIGHALALALAHAGADVVIHYRTSHQEAVNTQAEIESLGRKAYLLQADLAKPAEAARLIAQAGEYGPLFALINNAAIFEPFTWKNTTLAAWNRHLMINLTAPFLLSQAFAKALRPEDSGRIVNLLDWRSLRPGPDHLPYTISKAALAALTNSLAIALAPRITVNGLALGAILPPEKQAAPADRLVHIPAHRWGDLAEVGQSLIFLLDGPAYVTGEVLTVDGGRHLV